MAISPFRPGSLTRTPGTNFVSMRNDLSDLQRQLTTGQRADTYGALGFERRTSLDMRARLSAVEGYKSTIDQSTLRIKMMTQNLERLTKLGQDTKSDMMLAKFDLLSDGKTIPQKNAEARLKEVVDLMNTDLAGRSLFAGRAVDTLPIASFDHIMNGDGTKAGLKQFIEERRLADLGSDGRGRLAIGSAPSSTTITLSENNDPSNGASIRANFGFVIDAKDNYTSSLGAITATLLPRTAVTMDSASQPSDGQRLYVTVNRNGHREVIETIARLSPNASAIPKEFAIGGNTLASANNLGTALGGHEIAAVQSDPDLTFTATGGSAAALTLQVARQPVPGEVLKITLGMHDGTKRTIELTAKLNADPDSKTEFSIGSTSIETANNLYRALDRAVQEAARTDLAAASATMASNEFFAGSKSTPPLTVEGDKLVSGTASNTVIWYTGDDDPTVTARNTGPVRVDQGQVLATGARANEPAIRNIMAQLGVLAATSFEPTATEKLRYSALTERVFADLADKPGNPKVSDIASELANAAATMKAAKDRHASTESMIYDALDGVEGVNKEEAAMAILALQNQLQASYQTTSMLSRLSLVNYL